MSVVEEGILVTALFGVVCYLILRIRKKNNNK
mgnify:CR=1 FL=1